MRKFEADDIVAYFDVYVNGVSINNIRLGKQERDNKIRYILKMPWKQHGDGSWKPVVEIADLQIGQDILNQVIAFYERNLTSSNQILDDTENNQTNTASDISEIQQNKAEAQAPDHHSNNPVQYISREIIEIIEDPDLAEKFYEVLSGDQIRILDDKLYLLQGLDNDHIRPHTSEEVNLKRVMNNTRRPESELELAYIKYKEFMIDVVEHYRRVRNIANTEEGNPTTEWFTDEGRMAMRRANYADMRNRARGN